MPQISEKVPAEKRDVLLKALGSPDNEASKIIISKAQQRGWLSEDPQGPQFTQTEAAGRALEEGASLGLAKKGRAFAGGLFEALNPEPEQAGKPFTQRFSEAYPTELAKEKQTVTSMSEQFPKTTMAAKGVGSVVPLAASFAGTLPAIVTGTLAGGVEAFSEDEDVLTGAAKGAAFSAGGAVVGAGLSKLASGLKELSKGMVIKSMKLAPTTMRRLAVKGDIFKKAGEIADDLVKQDIASNPVTTKKMYEKTFKVMKDLGDGLSKGYASADDLVPKGYFTADEVKNIIRQQLGSTQKFQTQQELNKTVESITKGFAEKLGKGDPSGLMGSAQPKASAQKVWEYVKELDKTSKQWSRASDPAFASKAAAISDSANSLRNALLNKISQVDEGVAAALGEQSALYRNLSVVETSLSDQLIRLQSANKSIPRGTLFDKISEVLPGNIARTAGAKSARGAAQTFGLAGRVSPAAATITGLQGEQ